MFAGVGCHEQLRRESWLAAGVNLKKHRIDFHEAATVLDDMISAEGLMKQANRESANDMLPEYDFASMKGGARGKYVKRYRAGTNLVLLDPEVAETFPTDAAVNQVLRAVLSISRVVRPANKALHRTRQKTARRG